MTLRAKLVTYVIVAHVIFAGIAFATLYDRPGLLVIAEAILALSAASGLALARASALPSRLVRSGTNLMEDGDFTAHFRPTGHAEIDAMIAVYNRMIDSLREERTRGREQEGFVQKLIAASPHGVVTLDHDGKVALVNAAADRFLETPAGLVLGRTLDELDLPLVRALSRLPEAGSEIVTIHGRRRYKATRGTFYDRGHPRGFYVVEDLTADLHATEKAAYDKLIRMTTHEVNNSVAAVRSLLESVGTYAPQLGAEDRGDFSKGIDVAVTRLDHLNAFMRGFAEVVRIPPPDVRPWVLIDLVDDILVLMGPQLAARRIEATWSERAAAGPSLLDRNQIEQVLVNVVKNAMEAIGEDGRITLGIRAERGRVTLDIADSGPGLSEETRRRLFTPFFSTKRDGRGLGLTLVREILAQHRFGFELDNAHGGGARFRMRC
ncbi:MAG TPA: ATP-binding protein [Candidatus Polarisedimenticolaceae bacterium]|nr:ATP-binding protein [Candidatus Polarisedimenticolaceae bacterium]